jgi:hypothetical protein
VNLGTNLINKHVKQNTSRYRTLTDNTGKRGNNKCRSELASPCSSSGSCHEVTSQCLERLNVAICIDIFVSVQEVNQKTFMVIHPVVCHLQRDIFWDSLHNKN